jgi:DNA-binding response OmpR family regulator
VPERLSILIVEDEPGLCWGLETALTIDGHIVLATLCGQDGLDLAAQQRLDLAFIDAKLSDMSGEEVTRRLRVLHPTLTVVLISGFYYPEDHDIVEGLEQGLYQRFISKPFALADIRSAVQDAVARRSPPTSRQ